MLTATCTYTLTCMDVEAWIGKKEEKIKVKNLLKLCLLTSGKM